MVPDKFQPLFQSRSEAVFESGSSQMSIATEVLVPALLLLSLPSQCRAEGSVAALRAAVASVQEPYLSAPTSVGSLAPPLLRIPGAHKRKQYSTNQQSDQRLGAGCVLYFFAVLLEGFLDLR